MTMAAATSVRGDHRRRLVGPAIGVVLAALCCPPVVAQQLTAAERARVDSSALWVLAATGAPSASLAIVRGGEIVYERAYGDGRVEPRTPAVSSMRYAIGSVSKQFTATAVMLLAEEGRLSLDDNVSRWFPRLTRADEIHRSRRSSCTFWTAW